MKRLVTLFFLFLSFAPMLSAENVSVLYRSRTQLEISITPDSFTFPDVTEADFDKGRIQQKKASKLLIKSNISWILSVCCVEPDLGTLGGQVKPLSDLRWRLRGETSWIQISQISTEVMRGSGRASRRMDFRVLLDWEDDGPGDYSITLIATVEEQP